jgi:hypothetical protein
MPRSSIQQPLRKLYGGAKLFGSFAPRAQLDVARRANLLALDEAQLAAKQLQRSIRSLRVTVRHLNLHHGRGDEDATSFAACVIASHFCGR